MCCQGFTFKNLNNLSNEDAEGAQGLISNDELANESEEPQVISSDVHSSNGAAGGSGAGAGGGGHGGHVDGEEVRHFSEPLLYHFSVFVHRNLQLRGIVVGTQRLIKLTMAMRMCNLLVLRETRNQVVGKKQRKEATLLWLLTAAQKMRLNLKRELITPCMTTMRI